MITQFLEIDLKIAVSALQEKFERSTDTDREIIKDTLDKFRYELLALKFYEDQMQSKHEGCYCYDLEEEIVV